MDPTESVKTARPTRARKGRTINLAWYLPQGDRRPTAPRPRLWSAGPTRPGRSLPDPSRHCRADPTLGSAGVPVYAVTEEGVTPASTSRYLTAQAGLSSGKRT